MTDKAIKANIFDILFPFISFFTLYGLTERILDEDDYIGAALIYALFFLAATIYIISKRKTFHPEALLTGGCCIALTVALALHGSFFIIPLMMTLSALYCLSLTKDNLHTCGSYLYLTDLFFKAFVTPVANLFLPLRSIFSALRSLKKTKKGFGLLAGALVSLPVVGVLLFLLIESDAAFEGLTDGLVEALDKILPDFDFNLYAVIALIFTPYVVSVVFCFRHKIDPHRGRDIRKNLLSLRFASASFLCGFLGCVCLLYAVYILSQGAYLFSAFGGSLPEAMDISLSSYARRGFFEMSAVAAINLLLIGTGVIFTKRQKEAFPKVFKAICLFLCLFTIVLIFTAMSKMLLYISTMGLTSKRLTVFVFDMLMLSVFILIIIRLFRRSFPYFRYMGVICLVVVTVFAVTGCDPVISRYNTKAYLAGRHESLDMQLISHSLNTYSRIKALDKLVDDAKYGNEAREKLGNLYYVFIDGEDFATINEYLTKKYIKDNEKRFKDYYEQYSAFKSDLLSKEQTIYFRVGTEKKIKSVIVFDGISSQSVAMPESHSFFSFIMYPSYLGSMDFALDIILENGDVHSTHLSFSSENFFEITDNHTGEELTVNSLGYVSGLPEALKLMP